MRRIIYRCCDTRSVGRNWIENYRTKTLWDKRLDEETRYIVLLYKTDKFEGIVTSSEEGNVFWLTLDEMKQRKLAYGMDKMSEVFLN